MTSNRSVYELPPDQIVDLFRDGGCEVQRRGEYWQVTCPIHEDNRPSLKVAAGDKVPTVCTCFADCPQKKIWEWLEAQYNETPARNGDSPDVTIAKAPRARRSSPLTMAGYAKRLGLHEEFLYEQGLTEVPGGGVAFNFPNCAKIRVDAGAKYLWTDGGKASTFPLWPLPRDEISEEIWITEGESDCLVARFLGLDAYAVTSGSSAAPKHLTPRHFEALKKRGAKRIVLVPDLDEAGAKMASLLVTQIQAAEVEVGICDLQVLRADPFVAKPDPKDLHEWFLNQEVEDKLELRQELVKRVEVEPLYPQTVGGFEFRKHATSPVDWVLPDLIATGDVIGIVAPPKSLKTFFALDLMHSLASGEPFLRRGSLTPPRPFKCMLVEEEGHKVHFAKRMNRVLAAHDSDWVEEPTIRFSTGFLLDEASVDVLIQEIKFFGTEVVILDPWQRLTAGGDESSSSETAPMWDQIFRIRKETGVTILIIHHMRKDAELTPDAIRGSSRFRGEVDASILLQYDSESMTLYMVMEGRDIPHSAGDGKHPVQVIWEEDGVEVFALDGQAFEETVSITIKKSASTKNKEKVLLALSSGEWMTRKEIMDAVDMSENTVGKYLKALVDEDCLDHDDPGPGKAPKWKSK